MKLCTESRPRRAASDRAVIGNASDSETSESHAVSECTLTGSMQQARVALLWWACGGVCVCVARAEPAMGGCEAPRDAAPSTDATVSSTRFFYLVFTFALAAYRVARKGSIGAGCVG